MSIFAYQSSFLINSIIKLNCSCSGQKGIGFKSVFRVTDSPEVHSNGFHIKYDASSGPNGYILPQWVEEETTPTPAVENTELYVPILTIIYTRL